MYDLHPRAPEAHLGKDILSRLQVHVTNNPNKLFVQVELGPCRQTITYHAAWRDIMAAASALAEQSVEPRGIVLVFLPQGWSAIAYYLGAIARGCTASFMPLPSAKQDPDRYWSAHRQLMDRIRPAAIISTSQYEDQIRSNGLIAGGAAFIREQDLSDQASAFTAIRCRAPVLQHSSGTTGLKKGVVLTHDAILAQVEIYARVIDATRDDIVVSWLPLYHDMGLVACLLMPMILGQTIVLLDPFRWVARPGSLFEAIALHHGTLCWLPNFAFDHLAHLVEPHPNSMRLDSMRAFINCSEVCHAQTFRRFIDRFGCLGISEHTLQVCYAMAETTFAVTQTALGQKPRILCVDRAVLQAEGRVTMAEEGDGAELLSTGCPLPGTAIVIADESGRPLQHGMTGEICLNSPSLFSGYYHLLEETVQRFRDGLYRTRDRGFLHDGELYVLGRLDDMIIVAGRNFHAAEVESVLNQVPGLKPGRNVAFGVANAARGTSDLVVVAETEYDVAARTGTVQQRELRHLVRQAVFQELNIYPAEVFLVRQGWLQKTTSGKIERRSNEAKFLRETRSLD